MTNARALRLGHALTISGIARKPMREERGGARPEEGGDRSAELMGHGEDFGFTLNEAGATGEFGEERLNLM